MENNPYIVYVKTNANGYITSVNSSEFLSDISGWIEIDSGHGDKYYHAQSHYFPKRIRTDSGAYCYKLADGMPEECSAEEIAEQEQEFHKPATSPTLENRVKMLEADSSEMKEALEMILSGVTE